MGKFFAELAGELSLYTRMQAWLWTAPKPDNPAKGAAPKQRSRAEEMRATGLEPQLPENPAPHIIGWMNDLGWVKSNGMDRVALTLGDIGDLRLAGSNPKPWEVRLMRRLSIEFLAESRKAESMNCPPPWVPPKAIVIDHTMEERRLRSVLG